ncbi:MAG: recombination regulator RecX [Oscillospiraceae bacterium]|nr:recombination regulator RecX [Oscillospiraceae bacterium]
MTSDAPPGADVFSGEGQAKIRKRALKVLGSRMLSRAAVEKRLRELGETEEAASAAADWLSECGLVDDAELAREIARSYARRGFGARRIRDELYRRLIPREHWDGAMAEAADGEASGAAEAFIEKKLRGSKAGADDRRRVSAALARRGFSWDDIGAAWARRGGED